MKTEVCRSCGETAKVLRRSYRFEEMGVPVELQNIEVIECPSCHNADPIIPNLDRLMQVLTQAILCNPCRLNGSEIRFLRKYVGIPAQAFARYLGITHTHLSKLENDRHTLAPSMDKLIRLLVSTLDRNLAKDSRKLLERIPKIDAGCSVESPEIQIDPATMIYSYALAQAS